jgi:RNA polymerase sigma-70 factor (ECF subfamily)
MTGNERDAEDLVQETSLRAYKQLHRFDGRAAFRTWLYRICVNCSLDLLHTRKNCKELHPSADSDTMSHCLDSVAVPDPRTFWSHLPIEPES